MSPPYDLRQAFLAGVLLPLAGLSATVVLVMVNWAERSLEARQRLGEREVRLERLRAGIAADQPLVLAVVQQWSVLELMWPFWMQSVIIGYYARRRILALEQFSTEGLTMNDRPVAETPDSKRKIADFFVLHYGGFHAAYLMFLIMMGSGAFVATIAGVRFIHAGRFHGRAALGLTLGGIGKAQVGEYIPGAPRDRLFSFSVLACHSVPRNLFERSSCVRRRDQHPASRCEYRTATFSGTRAGRTPPFRVEPCRPLDRRFRRTTPRSPAHLDRAPSTASQSGSSAELRDAEGVSHVLLDGRGKAQEIALGGSDPMQRFLVRSRYTTHCAIIPVLGYAINQNRLGWRRPVGGKMLTSSRYRTQNAATSTTRSRECAAPHDQGCAPKSP